MPRLLVALAVAALALAWPPRAGATEQTAHRGDVSATFSFTGATEGGYADLHLTIVRSGHTLYDAPPLVGGCARFGDCGPGGGARPSVAVRDLDGDGEPEVLLDLYWGGAHCCFFANVYRFDGTGYQAVSRNFGDPGFVVRTLRGATELVSADDRFAYRFASYAGSFLPLRIWSYAHGRFHDRTARFHGLIRADARRAWRAYRQALHIRDAEPRGAIAAWAADRYRLGARRAALHRLRALARAGRLPGTLPKGEQTFVTRLDRFLRRSGY